MSLRVVAIVKDGKETLGYRVYNEETKEMINYPLAKIKEDMRKVKFANMSYVMGKIVYTECAEDRFSIIDKFGNVVENKGINIISRIMEGDDVYGYDVVGVNGERLADKEEKIVDLARKVGVSNGYLLGDGLKSIKRKFPTVDYGATKICKEYHTGYVFVLLKPCISLTDKGKYTGIVQIKMQNLNLNDLTVIRQMTERQQSEGKPVQVERNNHDVLITLGKQGDTLYSNVVNAYYILNRMYIRVRNIDYCVAWEDSEGTKESDIYAIGSVVANIPNHTSDSKISLKESLGVTYKDFAKCLKYINKEGENDKGMEDKLYKEYKDLKREYRFGVKK